MDKIACTRCYKTKPIEQFAPDKRAKSGRQTWCISCFSEHNRGRVRGATSYADREVREFSPITLPVAPWDVSA